ncbi:MAG: flagellar motor protein MotB [Myxococcota bacterium]|nr:flagellar motor protein MotB [Myxococcota bacterium]
MADEKPKRKKKKKNAEDQPKKEKRPTAASIDDGGSKAAAGGGWITTFADLMSLLMCFFVMILSMSTISKEKFKAMLEGMTEGLNINRSTMVVQKVNNQVTKILKQKVQEQEQTSVDIEKLRKLLRPIIKAKQIELVIRDRVIVIRILQGGSFRPGKAKLKRSFMPVARRLRKALTQIEGSIAVAGHTDNRPIKSRKFRSNWDLSGARAYSVMHELLKEKSIPSNRFVLNGQAETQPLLSNKKAAGRDRNRRVEIIIQQDDLGYLEKDHKNQPSKTKSK